MTTAGKTYKYWTKEGSFETDDFRLIPYDNLHRKNGPAIEYPDGSRIWYQNGETHRVCGPAIVYSDGRCEWVQHARLHRLDGPAIEVPNFCNEWWTNGKRHNEFGPAIDYVDGLKLYYLYGKHLSEEEFNTIPDPIQRKLIWG